MSESTAIDGNVSTAVAPVVAHNPRARKLRSLVWNDFTKERKPDGSYVAICNHCKKQLTASSRSGTTHLKNHLAICLSTKRVKRKKLVVRRYVVKSVDAKGDDPTVLEHSQFDQEVSRQDLARMVVQHGYRFSIVHDVGFRTFVRNLQPQFKMVSYDTVKVDCMRIYETARLRLHEVLSKLPCRLSLSIDMWRSNVGAEFMCLTCHYIDNVDNDWKLKKKILNFVQVDAPLTGEEISKTILEKLHDWAIDKKLASIVLDNCTTSDLVGRELLNSFQSRGFLLSNGDLFHVSSCVHILNLIVQESLQQTCELTNKVRACVHYVKSSQERLVKFQKAAKQEGTTQKPLLLDSPNNWASMYLMLESACQNKDSFYCLAEGDLDYPGFLSTNEWDDVKALIEVLDVLYHTMDKFTTAEKPTANLYFNEICEIHVVLKTWSTSQSHVVASMASQMLEKFEEYWGITRTVMAIASILDPCYKMKSVEYFFKVIYSDQYEAKKRIDNIHKSFINLYNEYAVQSASLSENQAFLCYVGNSSGCVNAELGNGGEPTSISRITLSDARRGLDQYLQDTSSGQPSKSDLDMYLEEPVYRPKGPLDNFDVLGWWRSFAAKYPVLSLMARDILAIPVSIVPLDSESRMLNDYLSTMDPVTVQSLICGQDWLREEAEAAGPMDAIALVSAATGLDGDADECMINEQNFSE
ncbi:zinc finger BED domain-containing protein RICESLEEPER 1-like isoform X2 [Typha latifolia]|uniref:zinc finger BED domain-containing protein RICESLEEPER 1-like isoform X2 n=1 Tax=Typha latifolia TaxID=4733 RepID=UPI003C30772E